MKTFELPYVIHKSSEPFNGIYYNGDGTTVYEHPVTKEKLPLTGNFRPIFDTMIVVVNEETFPVKVYYSIYDKNNNLVPWDEQIAKVIVLPPMSQKAISFIPFNTFEDAPNDFEGRATIDVIAEDPNHPEPYRIAVSACLGGGGAYPNYWNRFSPSLPVFGSKIEATNLKIIPYAINYEDSEHSTLAYNIAYSSRPFLNNTQVVEDFKYSSKLILTSYQDTPISIKLEYIVGQNDGYLNKGQQYDGWILIPPRNVVVDNLFSLINYPTQINSEGYLRIIPHDVNGIKESKFAAYLIAGNQKFDSFTSSFSTY